VTSRVDGQIVAVHFKEGDEVTEGALLFQLDPRPFQAQLDAAVAKAAQDEAQYDNARRTDDRNRGLPCSSTCTLVSGSSCWSAS